MKKYLVVYNLRSKVCKVDPAMTIESFKFSNDYVSIDYVDAKDLEDLFEILNVKHPKTFLEQIEKYSKQKYFDNLHSSMSVGDVAIELFEDGSRKYFICDSVGWKEFKSYKES